MANKYEIPEAIKQTHKTLGLSNRPTQQYMIHDNEVYEQKLVHAFNMGDVEDPELYCAQPIWEWQQTDMGKWVMKHGRDPTFRIFADPLSYGYRVSIAAHITPKRWTEFCLKFIDEINKR